MRAKPYWTSSTNESGEHCPDHAEEGHGYEGRHDSPDEIEAVAGKTRRKEVLVSFLVLFLEGVRHVFRS